MLTKQHLNQPNAMSTDDRWHYVQYHWLKDLCSLPTTIPSRSTLADALLWQSIVPPEVDVQQQAAFWFGSASSRTPCHYDSYGCNLVAQHYGSKQWLLFPPTPSSEQLLQPTRIPFEESTVWAQTNLHDPSAADWSAQAWRVVLYPGDLLFVPHHW